MKLIEMEKVLSELCLSHKDIIYIDKNETAERIRKIPSVDIEPKRGEWIDAEIRHEDGVLPIQVCSECKTFYPLEHTGGGHRFCPNCGCAMTKE